MMNKGDMGRIPHIYGSTCASGAVRALNVKNNLVGPRGH
jgi:hypothetical protein